MAQTLAELQAGRRELTFARQRAIADNAKLLTTFAVAVAATLVATALQVRDADGSPPDAQAVWSAVSLGGTVIVTVAVILLDHIRVPDVQRILDTAGKNFEEVLLKAELVAEIYNEEVISKILRAAIVQLLLVGITSVLASLSLIR